MGEQVGDISYTGEKQKARRSACIGVLPIQLRWLGGEQDLYCIPLKQLQRRHAKPAGLEGAAQLVATVKSSCGNILYILAFVLHHTSPSLKITAGPIRRLPLVNRCLPSLLNKAERREIRLIEGNAKCRHLRTFTCKWTLRQVFIYLRSRTPYPTPLYTLYTCIQYTY